jgi:hypothetical protein
MNSNFLRGARNFVTGSLIPICLIPAVNAQQPIDNYPEKVRVNPQNEIASQIQSFSSKEAMDEWVIEQLQKFSDLKSFFFFTGSQNHLVKVENECIRILSKINGLSGDPRVTDRRSPKCSKTRDFEGANNQLNAVYSERVRRNF